MFNVTGARNEGRSNTDNKKVVHCHKSSFRVKRHVLPAPSHVSAMLADVGSVVLEKGQQVVIVVVREVWRAEVGQQLVWVGQIWKQLHRETHIIRPHPPNANR